MKAPNHISRIFSLLGKFSSAALLSLILLPDAYADFYDVKVKKIASKSITGDVVIQFKPGSDEDRFTGRARGMLDGTDPATNKALAVILTAISLNTEVTIQMENPPSYDVIQIITSTSIIAP